MCASGQKPRPGNDVEQVAQAMTQLIVWYGRNDVQRDLMRQARCDLPRTHRWLLVQIGECPARLSELAQLQGVDKSTLSPQIQRLERDGLVMRGPDPDDGRASLVYITRAGTALLARIQSTATAAFAEALADWSPADLARTAKMLGRFAEAATATVEQFGGTGVPENTGE